MNPTASRLEVRSPSLRVCRPHDARRQNVALVTQLLYDSDGLSRAQLARLVGLTPVTVSSLVSVLASQGLVVETGATAPGRPGRRGTTLQLDAGSATIVAVDLTDHQNLTAASYSLRGQLRDRVSRPLGDASSAMPGLLRAVQDLEASAGRVLGVGVGVRGADDPMATCEQHQAWTAADVAQALSPAGLPISVGDEVGLAALAERRFGGHDCGGNLIRVELGDQITAGLLLDGSPVPGRAGAISHIEVLGGDEPCSCGGHGCLQTVLSASALATRFSDDPAALAEAGRMLGAALAPVLELLGVEDLIVSGPDDLVDARFLTAVQGATHQRAGDGRPAAVRVRRAALGNDAVLLGAAALVLREELGVR